MPGRRGLIYGILAGVPCVVVAFVIPGSAIAPAAVPALDAAAIACLLLTASIAAVDAVLSAHRQSLPILAIGLAGVVMWSAHLVLFPGDLPIHFGLANVATSSIFLAINLAFPIMLGLALLQRGGAIVSMPRALLLSGTWGLTAGALVVVLAILASDQLPTVTEGGQFNLTERWLGAAGIVPAVLALAAYLSGRRGDERVGGGIVAALVIQACNALVLPFLAQRYTVAWYADHLLSLFAAIALLAGQLVIFAGAIRREQRSVAALRTSLEMAEALARQVDLNQMIQKLLEGAMTAVHADRATLMTMDGDDLQIEASIDSRGTPAPVGRRLPIDALQVEGVPIVRETIRTGRPIATPAYEVALLDADHAESVAGIRHYITWPLYLGGEADAALFLARETDLPFDERDTELLSEFATMAALLLRNARLLRASEAASIAKSSFLNLAGHELRTPVAVIGGYIDLLDAGDIGPLTDLQADALKTLAYKTTELAGHVDQLLAVSRLDGRPLQALSKVVELRGACEAAIARARSWAREPDATLELEPGPPIYAEAVPASLALILDKLIANSLVYSRPPSRVRLSIDGTPCIRVSDTGIGIDGSQREQVFDRFHRVDRPDFGYPSGIGLGLYLAQQHADAMGATLQLESSELDVGSTFRLALRPAPGAAGLGGPGVEAGSQEVPV